MGQLSWHFPEEFPPGLKYLNDFISPQEEETLLRFFRTLSLSPYEFQGHTALRNTLTLEPPLPEILRPIHERAAHTLRVQANMIVHTLITQYPPGAPIGWHRDAPAYEYLLGISLASSCTMKLREMSGTEKRSLFLERRSAYIITGESRWRWEHHIPPAKEERYSLTFRTLVKDNPVSDHDL